MTWWHPKPLRPSADNPLFEMYERPIVVKGTPPIVRQRQMDGTPMTRTAATALRPADPELTVRKDLINKGSYVEQVEAKESRYKFPDQDPAEPLGVLKAYMAYNRDDKKDPDSNSKEKMESVSKAKEHEDPKGGLTAAGRKHFNKQEGSKLKPGVKGADADLSDTEKRRKGSFLTRHYKGEHNAKKPLKDEKGRPTRHALQAQAWGEKTPQNQSDRAKLVADGERLLAQVNKALDAMNESVSKAELTTAKRAKLKKQSFALPKERAYPIHDAAHARNALARVAQHGTPEEQKTVRAAVARKYPGIEVTHPKDKKESEDVDKAIPKKYHAGMKGKELAERKKEISSRAQESHKDPKSYRPFKTDKGHKTKKSSYTKAFKKKYGENAGGSVAAVASATGMSKDKLQEVYDRGLAAWRTGHRPGASQHAWGMARVYSFVMGGKTAKTADADLAKKRKPAKTGNESMDKSLNSMFASLSSFAKACGTDYMKAVDDEDLEDVEKVIPVPSPKPASPAKVPSTPKAKTPKPKKPKPSGLAKFGSRAVRAAGSLVGGVIGTASRIK